MLNDEFFFKKDNTINEKNYIHLTDYGRVNLTPINHEFFSNPEN